MRQRPFDQLPMVWLWSALTVVTNKGAGMAVIGIRVELEPPVSQHQTGPPCQSTWPAWGQNSGPGICLPDLLAVLYSTLFSLTLGCFEKDKLPLSLTGY